MAIKRILALVALSSIPAFAGTINTDGSWYEFEFGGVGSFGSACSACGGTVNPGSVQTVDAPWTFSGAATLDVLDLFTSGDQFQVFDNGVSLGLTSTPGLSGNCGNNIGCALADTNYSLGTFILGNGDHSVTIQAAASVGGGGAAVLSATAEAVPEPGTWMLLGSALGFVGLGRRFRKA